MSSRLSSEEVVVGVVLGEERVVLLPSLVTAGATSSELCCGSLSGSNSSGVASLPVSTYKDAGIVYHKTYIKLPCLL